MWFAMKEENKDMLSKDSYNAFFLVPLYLGMFYHAKVKIEGKVSKKALSQYDGLWSADFEELFARP